MTRIPLPPASRSRARTPLSLTAVLAVLAAALTAVLVAAPAAVAKESKEVWKGQPEFHKGESRGYFIWNDGEGWHVRWLSKGAKHTFSGRVTTDTALDKFEPVSRDSKDYIKKESERLISFDAKAKEGMDGFNFRASPSTKALKFELYIDGKSAPVDEVKLGKNKTRPSSVPVVIQLGEVHATKDNPKHHETK